MSSRTKIIVLHMKEIIYTGIFLLFLSILGILLFVMFGPGRVKTVSTTPDAVYTPGIYRSSIALNGNSFDVEVTVDADRIQSDPSGKLKRKHSSYVPACGTRHRRTGKSDLQWM